MGSKNHLPSPVTGRLAELNPRSHQTRHGMSDFYSAHINHHRRLPSTRGDGRLEHHVPSPPTAKTGLRPCGFKLQPEVRKDVSLGLSDATWQANSKASLTETGSCRQASHAGPAPFAAICAIPVLLNSAYQSHDILLDVTRVVENYCGR